MGWRVELFGGPTLISPEGQRTTRFATQKTAGLLAYLALTLPRSHPREVLAELFWPEKDPTLSRNSLSAVLSDLRPLLGSALVTDKLRVGLDEAQVTTDVAEFEAALARGEVARAAQLSAQEFLPGFYDDWVITQRERLEARESLSPPQAPSLPWDNLPLPMTSFIGRERECEELRALLEHRRLVTVTGAGGCGKTRLSQQVAARMKERFAQGVLLVELAALANPAVVVASVAHALGLKGGAEEPILETLVAFLRDKHLLLLLDNCEHLLEASAALVARLLRSCPCLQVLVTSRERLGVEGELVYRIPELSTEEAVQLFTERAHSHRSGTALTPEQAVTVAALCRRLDGIPLAIELAATRTECLSVEEIYHKLDDRFSLLTQGPRETLPRQKTLRALLDWSYALLSAPEKRLLERLSVFAGGWTLAAAEEVCFGEDVPREAILDLLTGLVSKSLVVAEPTPTKVRYHFLETLRQYAAEHLAHTGIAALFRSRHAHYYRALVESGGSGQEQANLRTGLEYTLEAADPDEALRFCGALGPLWLAQSQFSEGRDRCRQALERAHPPRDLRAYAQVLSLQGALAYYQGDYKGATALLERSLRLWEGLGDQQGRIEVQNRLGNVANSQGRYDLAQTYYEACLQGYQEQGDMAGVATELYNLGILKKHLAQYAAAWESLEESLRLRRERGDAHGIALCLFGLGATARGQGQREVSQVYLEQSVARLRELGNPWGLALALIGLGMTVWERGDTEQALRYLDECATIRREIADRWGIAWLLNNYGRIACAQGQPRRAVVLWGAAEALRETLGSPISQEKRAALLGDIATARRLLGGEAFAMARAQGRILSETQALDLAVGGRSYGRELVRSSHLPMVFISPPIAVGPTRARA